MSEHQDNQDEVSSEATAAFNSMEFDAGRLSAMDEDAPSMMAEDPESMAMPAMGSPTIARLPKALRPSPSTLCEICPASLWLSSATSLQCYCEQMRVIIWSTAAQSAITECDGYRRELAVQMK